MRKNFFVPVTIGLIMGVSAHADTNLQSNSQGEALAWTVAAYSSCDTRSELTKDFRSEAAKMDSNVVTIIDALNILVSADNVCALKNDFASEMLELSVSDMERFEAMLVRSEQPNVPVFQVAAPEGADPQSSIILTQASNDPPQSSTNPPSSDYNEN